MILRDLVALCDELLVQESAVDRWGPPNFLAAVQRAAIVSGGL